MFATLFKTWKIGDQVDLILDTVMKFKVPRQSRRGFVTSNQLIVKNEVVLST